MLSWIIGAVAIAIYAAPTMLSAVCGSSHGVRLADVLTPWLIMIPLALAGRLVAKFHRDAEDKRFVVKTNYLRAIMLRTTMADEELGKAIIDAMNDKAEDLKGVHRKVRWSGWASDAFYWSTYIVAGLGLLLVARAALRCTPLGLAL